MKYKYEDFDEYTLEESLEILREESKKRRIKADDLIIDIEEELKNQDESVAKCNELIQEIVDRLNQDNKMVCPKSNNQGICPFCGESNLEYGAVEFEGEMCYFPWQCLECKHEGEEWYSMEFIGHNVINENGDNIEIEDNMIEEE